MFSKNRWLNIIIIIGLIISGLFLVIVIVGRACDETTENIFNRLYRRINCPIGLDPSSPREMIIEDGMPLHWSNALQSMVKVSSDDNIASNEAFKPNEKTNERTNEAVLLIHGMLETPSSLSVILEHFTGKNKYDCFATLLLFHGRTVGELNDLDMQKVKEQVKFDIEYLIKLGYTKIYCFGYSLGAAILIDLSISNAFKAYSNKIKLILYVPAIATNVSFFAKNFLLRPFSYIKKYLTLNIERRYGSRPSGQNFPFYTLSRRLVLRTIEFSDYIGAQICAGNRLNNDFSLILVKNDKSIRYDIGYGTPQGTLADQATLFTTLESGGHGAHLSADPNVVASFFKAIDDSMEVLSS